MITGLMTLGLTGTTFVGGKGTGFTCLRDFGTCLTTSDTVPGIVVVFG